MLRGGPLQAASRSRSDCLSAVRRRRHHSVPSQPANPFVTEFIELGVEDYSEANTRFLS